MQQTKWNIYEAVILLDGYLKTLNGELPRLCIMKRVSVELCQMAANRGIIVGDVFRNENGISYQMRSMDSAYARHNICVPATKLFSETVDMYQNNRQRYNEILKEVKDMTMPAQINKDVFLSWSSSDAFIQSNKWTESNMRIVEAYGNKIGVISGSIFDVIDANVLLQLIRSVTSSKIFQITNRKIYKNILQNLQEYRYFCEHRSNIISEMECKLNAAAANEFPFAVGTPGTGEITSATPNVDFFKMSDFSFTKPTSLSFNSKHFICKNWNKLYVVFLKELYQVHKTRLDAIIDTEISSSGAMLICSAKKSSTLRIATKIADGLYVETNHSATTIVNYIKGFLDLCGVSYDDVIITYTTRDKSSNRITPQEDIAVATTITKYNQELLNAAEAIIVTSFVNGMRKNSTIAQKKFKNAFLGLTGGEFPCNIDIDNLASHVGIEHLDKIYVVSEESKRHIKELIHTAIEAGNHVMFYEELYQLNIDFMTNAGIFSPDLLKSILKQIMPDSCYKRASFSSSNSDSLENDITDCYDGRLMMTYGEIKGRLPYADMYQIRLVCSRDRKFVWAKEETYALAEKLQLSPADIEESKRIIIDDISKHGFSVFQHISAQESTELNPLVPEVAVKEAIYALHLSIDYERNRSIITLFGESFSPSLVMMEYCKDLKQITLSDLQAYEENLTSKAAYSLGTAYSSMMRVDKEHFVSIDSLSFDVHAIDNALELFVQGKIIPLKHVNSFTSFPEVSGHVWNLFMLDSYCQHFSIRFRSMGGPAKSKPVGAIFPAQMQFANYNDLLARVAAKNNLKLNTDDVSKFFTDNAYTLRRIDTNGIITKAQEIRIQED